MESFIAAHREKVTGAISCPDRVIFKGYLPISHPKAMEGFLKSRGLLFKQFKDFALRQSERIKDHAHKIALQARRPYIYMNHFVRKEDYVRKIIERDKVTEGLVCILATQESCRSFKLKYNEGCPKLQSSTPRCLCLYFYFIDSRFGLMYLRLPTWFPFDIQIYTNGHYWLARQMDRKGIGYAMWDNAFLSIENPERAQHLSDKWHHIAWPRILSSLARRVNPLLHDLLAGCSYYWVCDQFEYSTDVIFREPACLERLFPKLLEHALLAFGAEEVLTFLGRKLHGRFAGQILNDFKKRWPGARVKHRVKENWMKMYNKQGCVLRVETVINNPREFKIYKAAKRQGRWTKAWCPMRKGVANLFRYREVSLAANRRYFNALAPVTDAAPAREELAPLAAPAVRNGRTHCGFNPLCAQDLTLFSAVMRGEHLLMGFRNRDIRPLLLGRAKSPEEQHRHSLRVSRLLGRLHAHRLIAKIPRTQRWRVTHQGRRILSSLIILFNKPLADREMKSQH